MNAGRDACVAFILDLASRFAQHEDRLKRLEEQARQDSRTSSRPPSQDPPKTRQQRRAEARAKAKELAPPRRVSGARLAVSPGIRVPVASCGPRIRSMRSSITIPTCAVDAGTGSASSSAGRVGGSVAIRAASCRRSAWSGLSIARQLRCRHCRAQSSARVPAQIGSCAFGPRLEAAIVTLTARRGLAPRDHRARP